MAATGEVSNYLARNLILSGEAGSGERVGQDVCMGEWVYEGVCVCVCVCLSG